MLTASIEMAEFSRNAGIWSKSKRDAAATWAAQITKNRILDGVSEIVSELATAAPHSNDQ
jgi:hypothetical protein